MRNVLLGVTLAGLMTLALCVGTVVASEAARVEKVRGDVQLRLDAVFTGCAHLFPKRQIEDLAALAGRLGLLAP